MVDLEASYKTLGEVIKKYSTIDFRARGRLGEHHARSEFRAALMAYRKDLGRLENMKRSEKRRSRDLVAKIEKSAERVRAVCVVIQRRRARPE